MSKYDEERRRLGLQPVGRSESTTSERRKSKYDTERMELGLIPDTRTAREKVDSFEERNPYIAQSPAYQALGDPEGIMGIAEKRFAQMAEENRPQIRAKDPNAVYLSPEEVTDPKVRKDIERYKPYTGTPKSPADQFVSGLANTVLLGVPNALTRGEATRDTNTPFGIAGQIGGELLGFGVAQRLTRPLADMAVRRAVGESAQTLGKRAIEGAIRGGLAEGAFATAQELADVAMDTRQNQEERLGQRIGNVALRTGIGAGAEAGGIALGGAIQKAFSSFMNRSRNVAPEVEQSARELISTPTTTSTTTPTIARRGGTLSDVMERIRPLVMERMTPPLENPNELAKWVKNNLGDETLSLNEVRRLPYEDLRQLAEEIRRNMSVYDTAVKVAREQGINLERLLSPTRPTMEMVQRARLRDVAGVPGPVRRGAQTVEPTSNAATQASEPAQPVRQGWFERLFGTQPLGIISRMTQRGRNPLTTEGQIVDAPIKRTTQGTVQSAQAAARSAYHNFVDRNVPIKKISQEAYEASEDAARANQIANVIITDKFVDLQGNVIGEGLQNIVRKAGRGNYNAFTDYLIARHALTRMSRGERVYAEHLQMTPEKVAERIRTLEQRYPGFREIAREWDQYFKNIREVYGVEEGLISRELADLLEQRNPNYAPMRRQFSMEEKIKTFTGKRPMFSGQKAPIQEVSPTGSVRKIVDPVRSTIEQTGAWVQAAMRNRVMREIVERILQNPEDMKGIAEIVQPPKGSPNLRELIMKEGEDGFLEHLAQDFNKLFQRQRVDKDNIVRAMVNGQPVYVKVHDPEAVKALLGMGAENAGLVLRVLTTFSNMIKRGATGALAPLFAVKSATMDVAQALIQAENPLKHAGYLMGAVVSSIADALNIPVLRNMAQDFYRTGGGYSAALRGERALRRSVGSMRLDPLLSPRTLARGVGNLIALPYRASLKVADIAENMNRIAAFHYKLRQLGGERTPENIREAMNYAREITVNYSRKGRQSQLLEALIPYNNAAIQGLYRFAKAWKENPVKTTAMVTLGVLLPKFYEYMQFHDDPDYNALPARERYRNLFLSKNADGTFVKIPLSPEYNALGALMVDMLRAYKDGDPEAFKGASDAIMNAFTPPLVSGLAQGFTQGGGIDQSLAGAANATSLAPVAAVMANRTFYGAPIDSRKVEDRSPQYRYDERTSAVAKWLGQQLKWSPMKIDYVLRAYGGDPARILLPLTSDVGRGTTRNTLLRNWITDPVFTNTLTDDFYMGKELLTQAYRDHQEVGAPLPEWYNDSLRRQLTSTAAGSVTKRLSALTEQKRQVNLGKSLSAEEKAQKLRDIQREMNEIYIEMNSRMRETGVPILSR